MSTTEKDLKTIQKIAKACKVISKIIWICCIVNIVSSLVGIIILAKGADEAIKIGGVSLYGIISSETGMTRGTMYAAMAAGIITYIGSLIPAIYAERYFKNELKAGTPFTYSGAKELKSLAILTIVIPLASTVLAGLAISAIGSKLGTASDISPDNYLSLGLGIGLLIMSVIFRYGAGLEARYQEAQGTERAENLNPQE